LTLRNILIAVLFIGMLQIQVLPESLPTSKDSAEINANASFVKFYAAVNELLNAKDWTELNKYAHPDYGFYIYYNPGVRVEAFNFSRFDDLIDTTGKTDEAFLNRLQGLHVDLKHRLLSGKVPVWDCGNDRWNKKGNYCQDISSCPDLSENVLSSAGCDENPNHQKAIKAKQFGTYIKKHIIQTSGYNMYFAFIDGNWYIAVIDLCYKCSA